MLKYRVGGPPKLTSNPIEYLTYLLTPYTAFERAGIARNAWFHSLGWSFFLEQSTEPQTLGYSLADSPAGLLAYIYEKLFLLTDNYSWTDDEGTFTGYKE
jgi:hypothetical protein